LVAGQVTGNHAAYHTTTDNDDVVLISQKYSPDGYG
jgi:hypothetical protein